MTIKMIACEVMKEELLAIKTQSDIEFEFISMGLHLHPEKLNKELQRLLQESGGYEKIILAFGLCGGAVKHLQAGDCPLIIPRVHDCIPLFLGSIARYKALHKAEKGTFYLSCGWMVTEKNILSEHQRIVEKHGEKKALRILARMYDSYRRVLFIHTGCKEEAESLRQSQQIAELLAVRHETVQGESRYLDKLVNGLWHHEEFIHIAPQQTVLEEEFGIGVKAN